MTSLAHSTPTSDPRPCGRRRSVTNRLLHEGDLSLVHQVLTGDTAAIGRFVQRLQCVETFVAAVNRRCGRLLDDDLVRDVAQDVFLAVWSNLARFRGDAGLTTWVYKFCELRVRKASHREVSRRFSPMPVDVIDTREVGGETADGHRVVEETLDALMSIDARIVRLKLFESWTFDGIAYHLGWATSTVKTRYYRALARLRIVPTTLSRSLDQAV